MAYKNLQDFLDKLEQEGELIRIKEFVNTDLEITEITDRISKQKGGGKAIFFENTGKQFPVVANIMGSDKRMAMALLQDNLENIGEEINQLIINMTEPKDGLMDKLKFLPKLKQLTALMPKILNRKGACQDVVITENIDINILPVLKCWPDDGGNFITLPVVHTKDPNSGIRNVAMYRMQVFDKTLTGMHWHKHKVGARHYQEYKELGKKMPVAVALGGDPSYTYVATAPLPDNIDEYMLAGFIRKKKVELVKCITQDIEVPADSDFIIEGYVDPQEELIYEGPFGDHTGFYSLADYYPKFHITAITHKKNAIYPTTIVGIPPQEDAYIAKATERIFLPLIKLALSPEIIDMNIPIAGVSHNITIVNIKKTFPGQAIKVMNALWGAGQMMFNKSLIVVDEDIDIHNYTDVLKIGLQRYNPKTDTYFSKGPLDILDHSSDKFAYGSKIGIDATKKLPEEIDEAVTFIKPEILSKLNILKSFPEITDINIDFANQEIPILFIAIKKNKLVKKHAQEFIEKNNLKGIKIIIFVDFNIDIKNLLTTVWITANNIAPLRDSYILESQNYNYSLLVMDGTTKTLEIDNFKREWPDIITMDKNTIENIDKKWDSLNIGEFTKSPSLEFLT